MSRKEYRWGAKQFLANMEIGERVQDDGTYNWRGMQRIAVTLWQEFGSKWQFRTTPTGRYITRVM
jgi:hypothetical protein